MATIRKFTEIRAWQVGRELAKDVYAITKSGAFAKDYGFRDQVQRAAVSINSNIAEGFERDSNAEFVKFLGYAKGSVGELLSQFSTAHDIGYLTDAQFEDFSTRLNTLSVMLARFRTKMLNSELTGLRWREPSPQPRVATPKDANAETQKLQTQKRIEGEQ